jgi:succinoglycan biosynthesis protein ExoL
LFVRIAYFVHNFCDPAVIRRVRTFERGGASIKVIGFQRGGDIPAFAQPPLDLGTTFNAQLVRRIGTLLRACLRVFEIRREIADADAMVARNLEMLLLAVLVALVSPDRKPLTYESLDIHRTVTASGGVGILLRLLEGALTRRAHLLITSSPAFVANYFERKSRVRLPVRIVENKVKLEAAVEPPDPRVPGPPCVADVDPSEWLLEDAECRSLVAEIARRA